VFWVRGFSWRADFYFARIFPPRGIPDDAAGISGAVVKLSDFYCERCQDTRAVVSGPKGLLEFTILPLFLIWHVRCKYCGDRYATFGFGKGRIVFRRQTSLNVRKAAVIIGCAVIAAGVVAFIILR
jgi:hypothetical protein